MSVTLNVVYKGAGGNLSLPIGGRCRSTHARYAAWGSTYATNDHVDLTRRYLQPVQRTAHATHQSVEALLLTALQAALPPLEGLSPDVEQHLITLESRDDQALWRVMLETVPRAQQRRLHALLARQQAGRLTASEQTHLTTLQRQADLVMLRKARAAVLLRFRGKRVPTVAELDHLATMDT